MVESIAKPEKEEKDSWAEATIFVNKTGGRITRFEEVKQGMGSADAYFEGEAEILDETNQKACIAKFPIKANNIHEARQKFEANKATAHKRFVKDNSKPQIITGIPPLVPKIDN